MTAGHWAIYFATAKWTDCLGEEGDTLPFLLKNTWNIYGFI